jgi:hypothetical protein
MDPNTQTEEMDRAGRPDPAVKPTVQPQPLIAALGHQCAACGALLAPDQRYCLQCGERSGPSGLTSLQAMTRSEQPAPVRAATPRRLRLSANSTLIAGVGTLLLAMGIGVLIGRSGNNSSSKPAAAVQVVTVPGVSGTASAAGSGAATQAASSNVSATSKRSARGAAASSATTSSAIVKPKKSAPPPTKVVTVGSPGSGPGYQKGHFTGNFFGG